MMPSDHRSAAGWSGAPRMRSGAMYSGEPTMPPVTVSEVLPATAAIPKSVSTADEPPSRSRTFAGLTSRWWIPAACAARSPASTSRPRRMASAGGSGPRSARPWRLSPGSSSITSHGYGSMSTMW